MSKTVHVTMPIFPGTDFPAEGVDGLEFDVEDTPELRAQLEQAAIPGCKPWRLENHEPCQNRSCEFGPDWHRHAAPYCPSAYCVRCAALRALDGVDPITPNEWMNG